MFRKYIKRLHLSLAILVMSAGAFSASAGECENPNLPEASMFFNESEAVMQYCNGAEWIAFPKGAGGGCTDISAWNAQTMPASRNWDDIAFGNGVFVATSGQAGSSPASSPDGVNWTLHSSYNTEGSNMVAFGDNKFVMAQEATWGARRVFTSPDGAVWTQHNNALPPSWPTGGAEKARHMVYGGGQFVIVGDVGAIATSPDGVAWTVRTSGVTTNLTSVAYGNGRFVAGGQWLGAMPDYPIVTSTDGITWTPIHRTDVFNSRWVTITFGNGLFVAKAYQSAIWFMYSTDGVNWTQGNDGGFDSWGGGHIGYGNGMFVTPSYDGATRAIYTSTDGMTWGLQASPVPMSFERMAYGNGAFVGVESGSNAIRAECMSPGCEDPEAPAGAMIFNVDHRVLQYCDGADWQAAGLVDPPGPATGCEDPEGGGGDLVFNADYCVMQYCDGADWRAIPPDRPLDPCICGGPGTTCADGTIFAGISPDGDVPMYTTPADAPSLFPWNNGTETFINTAMTNCSAYPPGAQDSCRTGRANTQFLVGLIDAASPYEAAVYCASLSGPDGHGHADWYLPAQDELQVLYLNQNEGALAGTFFPTTRYRTSSERGLNGSPTVRFSDGDWDVISKSAQRRVRCVRR